MGSNGEKLLEVRNVSKSFFGNRVLNDVGFSIDYGEVFGLVGENGAGKSTLIKIITGVYRPDNGTILIDGNETHITNINVSQSLGISVVFQELSLAQNLTVAENIFIGHLPANRLGLLNRQKLYNKTQGLINKFRVAIEPDNIVGNLSIGNRQIVEILKALALQPKLLILDEPTSSLEDEEINALFDLITQLKNNHYSIIYISHHLREIFRITDNVMVLRDGEKIGIYKKDEIEMKSLVRKMINKDVNEFFGTHTHEDYMQRKKILLEVKNLTKEKHYKNVSFSLYEGEILGFAGIVGSGKTELCKSLFGILEPDSGEIFLNGKQITIVSPDKALKNKIVYLPESRKIEGLFLRDSVRNNIIVSILKKIANTWFMSREKINKIVGDFINLLNIKVSSWDQKVTYLSGGNQQKVLVSKCLAPDPRILVAIDPTRGIDVGSKAEIHRILHEISDTGVSVLLVSSELDEVIAMSDRILIFLDGEIVETLERKDFNYQRITLSMNQNI